MYVATYCIDLAALAFLIWLLKTSTALNRQRKKPFLAGIVLTIVIIMAEAGTVFAGQGGADFRTLNIVCNILGFVLTPIIPLAIMMIFSKNISRRHLFLLVPSLINMIVVVLSPFGRFIFTVDADNHYSRGDFYLIFIAVYTINFLLLVISTLKVGKKHNYPLQWKMLVLSVFTITGTTIQIIDPTAYSSWHCVTLALFLYFILMAEFDSSFDTLTGLYNRAAFDKASSQIVKNRPFSLIILDINDFKSINDTYGHYFGDTVIKQVADIVRSSFKKHYTCYRFGGDEFSIIGHETDRGKIETQLRTMTKTLTALREKGSPLPTISYGYSLHQADEPLDFDKVLKEADDQMYQYKKARKSDTDPT